MTPPAFSPAGKASSASSAAASAAYGPAASDAPATDAGGIAAGRDEGGFAAALEEATAGLEGETASSADGAASAASNAASVGAPASTPATAASSPHSAAGLAPGAPAANDAGHPGEAPAAAISSTARAPGWPPPGLSSLFPGGVLAGAANATGLGDTGTDAQAPLAPGSTANAANGSATALAASRALPATNAAGVGAANLATAALAAGALSGAVTAASAPAGPRAAELALAAMPMPIAASPLAPAATLPSTDALAAALARQPAVLRLPNLDDTDGTALSALAESLAPERLPDGALPLSTAAPTVPKLDLLQAFPAPVPLPSPRFAEDVGARLQWIAEQQGGEATLRISPDGLGPVEIRLKLDGDRVELGFSASQQDTRQALQDALPKLREMLAQQGLQLGHADVGQKHAQTANDQARRDTNGAMGEDGGDAIAAAPAIREATLVIGRGGRGVLDLYA